MKRMPTFAMLRLNARIDLGWVCACLSRLLLLLVAVELITMPLTQHIWTWDNFLHGGHDFELTLLTIVTCLCFVLLRTQHGRSDLGVLLAMGSFLLLTIQRRNWMQSVRFGHLARNEHGPLPIPLSALQTLPLLI